MERLVIQGGRRLSGETQLCGAKNSCLPLLAATALCNGESVLHNCPHLKDVSAAIEILQCLGCKVRQDGDTIAVNAARLENFSVPESLMAEMRSSIVFLGAITARTGRARLSFPGGCELGPRPIDLHLSALRRLGLTIDEAHGFLECSVSGRLHGAQISLSFPSVGATENIILAACTAQGETVISNAASEPEIVDLTNFLNACGARISGAGENTVVIEGVESLHGAEHSVIPDRIVAATYLCCAAVTGGELLIEQACPEHLASVLPILEQTGCRVLSGADSIYIKAKERLKPPKTVRTMPYPGFPTDAQAPLMAVACLADGTSVFVENIFESRYKHAGELMKMGANIKLEGKVAVVEGVKTLHGANVRATDLRGGAALIVAGLAAQGTTVISEVHHIDRGYAYIEQALTALGCDVRRETKDGDRDAS